MPSRRKPSRQAKLAGDLARSLFAKISKTQKDNIDALLPLILHDMSDEDRDAIATVIKNDLHLNRAFEQLQLGDYHAAETILNNHLLNS